MKTNKELNNQDLNSVVGGENDLDKYLKTLTEKDQKKQLVGYETGTQLDLNSDVYNEDDGNAHLIKREKDISKNDSKL